MKISGFSPHFFSHARDLASCGVLLIDGSRIYVQNFLGSSLYRCVSKFWVILSRKSDELCAKMRRTVDASNCRSYYSGK